MAEAATIWNPPFNGEGEYSPGTAVALVDPLGVALVDPAAVAIFDTGQSLAPTPSTVWTNDPGS